jgi:hypothetical protein
MVGKADVMVKEVEEEEVAEGRGGGESESKGKSFKPGEKGTSRPKYKGNSR